MHYIVRHSNVADRLQGDCSEVIPSTIKIIENDPDIIAAMENTQTDTVLEKIIETAAEHLPEVINTIESSCKLVHQEQKK